MKQHIYWDLLKDLLQKLQECMKSKKQMIYITFRTFIYTLYQRIRTSLHHLQKRSTDLKLKSIILCVDNDFSDDYPVH